MKYPPAPLTPFFTSLPLTRPHRFLRHARPSRTAQVLSAAASIACALLNSLASLFAAAVLYFQSLAHSFAEHPGYGVSRSDWWTLGGSRRRLPMPETVLRDTQGGVRLPLLQFGSPQRTKSFASYHIPATIAFSCDYALFPSQQGLYPRAAQDSASTFLPVANDAIFNNHPMCTHCCTAHTSLNWNQR